MSLPFHPAMIATAATYGYDLTPHRAHMVNAALLEWADVVLAMDHTNLAALQRHCDRRTRPKLSLYLGNQDVPDPFGRPASAFQHCLALIEFGAERHLQARDELRPSATESTS
ncbi:hypothetical protein [Nocardia sp. XZ_19_369]|uniref:arsenate reductase/protein-tyrosine-phosphatase family protein n=1 Tax=Nocardia sp. XZ_19_369 TaxID=2769487 RepID=UPI002105B2E5|nr:hypothetical protein [Nocardia sp. XZ_19_369]